MDKKYIFMVFYFMIPLYLLFSPIDLMIDTPEGLLVSRGLDSFKNIVAMFMIGIGILYASFIYKK